MTTGQSNLAPRDFALWRTLSHAPAAPRAHTGLDAAWARFTGLLERLKPRRRALLRRADRVLALEKEFDHLSDAALREEAAALRERFRRGRAAAADLERGFAVVREAAFRETGLRAFRVQLAGAFALEGGCIAEMATGEGKTLTATFPATIAGWRGLGCHVVTVNDYLAQRDAEWMAPVYRRCGVSVAGVTGASAPEQRRAAYAADVTYATNKEVAADFLRDRLALERLGASSMGAAGLLSAGLIEKAGRLLVQRGLACAIVDEADSVLIDEAVTPLIISGGGKDEAFAEAHRRAALLAEELIEGRHYRVDRGRREVTLTDAGRAHVGVETERLGGIWASARRREELLTQALAALRLYERGSHYVVQDDKAVIVDEFTGRLMPDRTWRDGFHQAVEAKEGLEISAMKETLARVSFQRFFRLYDRLSGMTGTAREQSGELWRTYALPVVPIPTNRPVRRRRERDRFFPDQASKWETVAEEIERTIAAGRSALVGARSVQASEHLSALLERRGVDHVVLNAVRAKEEAQIIHQAGRPGRVTVATNMAGRGADIPLDPSVRERGGLRVIATERHESARIDRQLFGRAGRQGDPGSGVAFVAIDDELLVRFGGAPARLLRRLRGSGVVSTPLVRYAVARAQRRAQALAARRRRRVLRSDDWLDDALGFGGARY